MKKLKTLMLLTLSFLTTTLDAQSRYYKEYYQDQLEKGEKMLRADYQGISVQTAEGDYVKKIYYPEKKVLTQYITYKKSNFKVKEGPSREWYDSGQLWKEGAYENNEMSGIWTYYDYYTGAKKEYGPYVGGEKKDKWTSLDSLGRTIREQHYQAGKPHGACAIYDRNGQLAITREYENGKMVSEQKLLDNPDVRLDFDALQIKPYHKGCESENAEQQNNCSERMRLEAVYKNIQYPYKARVVGVMGIAVIEFVVEKDGSVTNITVLRGLCWAIEQECLRVMDFMPEWMPGQFNDKPVRVAFNVPINFKLE